MTIKNCKECPFCVRLESGLKSCNFLPIGFLGYNYDKKVLSNCPLKSGEIVVKLDESVR